ncbi:MAG TPA: peptide ABC transporter substrate-binding protein [Egibacteraceae bacterium]|jgi:peptide/nickel transport system substrate-binding protein|nr:peptide ABC transporter substrate-binding protein [Egibacteraceae bacterium]
MLASLPPARWVTLLVLMALGVAACAPGQPDDREGALQEGVTEPEGERVEGGNVIFGHEQEPAILNPALTEGNLFATQIVTRPILLGAYLVTPEFEYVPELIDGEAETEGGEDGEPFVVTWNILEEATWSDGTPITADDFEFTYQTVMDEEFDITSRNGYDLITETEVVDDKTWRATFEEPFAPYRTLFGVIPVLPAHVLEGEDFNEVWNDGIVDPETDEPIASGPFQFGQWRRGQQLTIERNEGFWGEQANLDRITFRYIEETPTLVQQIRGGEINIFDPQPQVDLIEQLEGIDGVEVQSDAGPQWEHIDFNHDNPALANQYVREAIIRGIDREAIVEQLVQGVNPEAGVLQNAIFVENQEQYEPHWDVYDYDPEAAIELLEENGCTRDGDDGVFTCDGEELSFRYVSTSGNERRELMFEIVQAQLAEIGVEVTADFSEPAQALGTQLPEGDFDLINFGWVGSPDPFGGDTIFMCDGDLNYIGYCNEEVTELLERNTGILDEEERWAVYNEADELIAADIPLIPLFQIPQVLAYEDNLGGVRVNATQWGPTWNASEWYLTE